MLKYSTPYLPVGLEKNVAYAVQYAHDLNDSVSQVRRKWDETISRILHFSFFKAKTLGELKSDAVAEAREHLAYVQTIFLDVLERISVYPPISWLVSQKTVVFLI